MIRETIKKMAGVFGYEIRRAPPSNLPPARVVVPDLDRIHYGCGDIYMPGWLNVDVRAVGNPPENYMDVNLVTRHPFPDSSFRFGFTQDFIEHIDQVDSITFLAEVFRTFKPGGVLRVSFPGFEHVLCAHFPRPDFDTVLRGKHDAYDLHRHRHFYSRESLALVARQIGYSIEFVEYGKSKYVELCGLDTRIEQISGNIRAELTKP